MFLPILYISLWQMLLPVNCGRCFNHIYNTEADVIIISIFSGTVITQYQPNTVLWELSTIEQKP